MTPTSPQKPAHDATGTAGRPLPHSCGRCGAHWAGNSTAHCGAQCHQTFTSPRSFDRHRGNGECRLPATAGLIAHERAGYLAWGYPMDDAARDRLLANRAGVAA